LAIKGEEMTNQSPQPDLTVFMSMTRLRATAPIFVLIFLSPVLTELLMGVYGFAALIIREVTRRLHRGWGTILLLGIAYAIAGECVILQTSLTPQFFPLASSSYGWAFGVQWVYLVAMLWYESVYAIVLPIYLTELLFPDRRDEIWLDRRGVMITIAIFLLSSLGVWWLWSHVGLRRYENSTYQVPPLYIGTALAVIAALVAVTVALSRPSPSIRKTTRQAWSPWLVGFMAFGFGLT